MSAFLCFLITLSLSDGTSFAWAGHVSFFCYLGMILDCLRQNRRNRNSGH